MALDMISGAAAPAMMGAGPPDPGAALGAAPGGGGAAGGADSQAADILGQALDLLQQYMQIEPDEEDKAVIAQCVSNMQRVRAKDQQDADKITQGSVTPRALRAALNG